MGRITEHLNGGLWDGADPASLLPGQLSYIRNAIYGPNSQSLQRAMGRTGFGTATAAAASGSALSVPGLRDITFDNGDHYLVAMTNSVTAGSATASYSTAVVGDTGTFGILTTGITAGSGLEVLHYNNKFYLLNGTAPAASGLINTNSVIYLSATATGTAPTLRQHGMLPVSAMRSPSASAASAFSLTVTGYYEYWTTEIARTTADGAPFDLESTFSGDPLTCLVSALTYAPVISMPTLQNPAVTTHWRVYRSPKKDTPGEKKFPVGFVVADAIGTGASASALQFVDTLTVTSTSQVLGNTIQNPRTPFVAFTNAATLTADNGAYASGTPDGSGFKFKAAEAVYGFNFGGFSGAVQGIAIEIKAYLPGGGFLLAPISVAIGKRGATGEFVGPFYSKSAVVTATSPGQVLTLGSSTDRWAPSDQVGFFDTDFDTNFMVQISFSYFAGLSVGVDYIKAQVTYGAGQTGSVVQFPTVVYTFGDISAQVGKNGPPPSSDTGDMYNGQMVLNDKEHPSFIRYSAPEMPEYFPSTYFVDIETRDNDIVRLIKVVNNRLMVALDNSIWRVNYLPSERDASFDRGKCFEPLSQTYGCINPMCAATFSMDGPTQRLAWVSQKGIHMTDGYNFSTLTDNIAWRSYFTPGSSTAIALINDPENQDLVFYFTNTGFDPDTYLALHLSYANEHVTDEGRLKVSGPVHMRNFAGGTSYAGLNSAWPTLRSNGRTDIYLGYGAGVGASATAAGAGVVYRENGTTIPAADNVMRFRTRRMFLAGEGSEFRANEVYGYIGSYTSAVGALGIDMATQTLKTMDDAGEVTQAAKTVSFGGKKIGKWQFRQSVEGLRISAAITGNPNNDVEWEYLIIDGEGFGAEDSGK